MLGRDGNKCWICGKKMNRKTNHPMSMSIDHLVQRKYGGSNKLENLRLAHKRCNNERDYSFSPSHFSILQWETEGGLVR